MTETSNTPQKRPLSPHLQIYKPQLSSTLSILHRVTGVALAVGFVVFVAWISLLAFGTEDMYDCFLTMAGTIPSKIALCGWAWALSYHLCTGFRHLIWDIGYGYEICSVTKSSILVLLVSTALALYICLTGFGVIS